MKKDQELLLAVEDIDSEGAVFNRRRLEDEDQSPLIGDDSSLIDSDDTSLKSTPLDQLPWYRRPSVRTSNGQFWYAANESWKIFWLLTPFALSALAFGGVIVPKVNLILTLICNDYFRDNPPNDRGIIFTLDVEERCRIPEVQARVATFKLLMSLISGILAAVVAPKLGALSDRYGRTRMSVIVNTGMIINELITIVAATFSKQVSVWWILVGAIFDGGGGSFNASMALAHSYAADCTPYNKRNVVFGYFHGCLYTGIAAGPVIAGYIIKRTGKMIVMFYLASGCHMIFALMLLFIIPESVPKSRQLAAREKHREAQSNQPTLALFAKLRALNILEPLKILYGPDAPPAVRRNLVLLASTDAIVFGLGMGASTVVLLYSNYVFGWQTWEQSKFTSIVNSCRVSCLLVILPTITHFYRKHQEKSKSRRVLPEPDTPHGTDNFELSVIRTAIFADAIGFLGYGAAPTGQLFTLSGAITSIGGTASPTMQAALTKHVPKENVGQLLGAMGLLHSLGRAIGPFVFTGIYAATVSVFPQAYFVVLAAFFGVAWIVSWFVKPGGEFSK